MRKTLFLLFILFTINISSQQYIFGHVVTEQNLKVSGVLVINLSTNEKTTTDKDGNFMISGKNGDYLRFVKPKYERVTHRLVIDNFTSSLQMTIQKSAIEIQEVELKPKLTGDLDEDSKTVEQKKITKLNKEISQYINQKSAPEILKPKQEEFVQPKGEGFSIGKISNQWDQLDLINYIINILGENYFKGLGLNTIDIDRFVSYVLEDFDSANALKYGRLKTSELLKFQQLAEEKIKTYVKLKIS